MNIFDLDNIKIVTEKPDKQLDQVDFYDLTETTFQSRNDVTYGYYYVQQDEEMRIDLICYRIYNNVDLVDILLNINGIDNPMNIKQGDVLKYTQVGSNSDVELFRVRSETKDVVQTLLSRNKASKRDENRKKYIGDNFSLPPTVLPSPLEPVVQIGDNIVIGGGLF